jgi:putative transposase
MSRYRRAKIAGGTFFFTVTLADRRSDLLVRDVDRLRRACASVRQRLPFETHAICILPDHLHALWQLPDGDANFALRWNLLKANFSRGLSPATSRSASKIAKREKGLWQVLSRIFRTFDQAIAAPVSKIVRWYSGRMFM